MKLPSILRGGNTTDRIEAARQALAAAEGRIAELEQQRAVALADSDEDIGAVDRELDEQRRAARAFGDRLAALQVRATDEAGEARQKAYEAGVAAVERALPKREKAAVEIEEAIKLLAGAVRKYDAITSQIVAEWPTNVPKPGSTGFGGYFSSHFLTTDRLGARLRDCLLVPMRRPVPQLFVNRVASATERAEGFRESESKNSAELIAELHQRGAPPIPVIDDDEEMAA